MERKKYQVFREPDEGEEHSVFLDSFDTYEEADRWTLEWCKAHREVRAGVFCPKEEA